MDLERRPDAMMLEGACVNYARAVQADLTLDQEGLIVEESTLTKAGEKVILKIRAHPAVNVSNAAWRQVRQFCGEFGLSPVSRTRLAVESRKPVEDDLQAMLSTPREPRLAPVQ